MPTTTASWPIYRWQKPPISPMPYIWPARSSKRRISSMSAYQRLSVSAEICASAGLTRLGLRATAIPGVPPDSSEAWWQTPRFATSGAGVAGLQNGRSGAAPIKGGALPFLGLRVLKPKRSARLLRLDDDDLVGRRQIEHAADLTIEKIAVDVIGPHIGSAAFELGALGRDIGEPRLCQPQFLGCAHPRPQPAIALDEVISEIPGERQTQHGGDEHLGAA